MNAVVVIAWRDLEQCPYRRAALVYVRGFYDQLELPVVMADCADPFTKARALNSAIELLTDDTIVIQSDPDSVLTDILRYREAVLLAYSAPGLVIPHTRYLYLAREASEQILRFWWEPGEAGPADCEESGHAGVGNVTVFSRATWLAAGGYDERFPLWAGDDAAFAYACGALAGEQRRLPGDVIHLWHPRLEASLPGSDGYDRQAEILDQYRDAEAIGPEAVRALIEAR